MIRVNRALDYAKKSESLRLQDPAEALTYQKDILDTVQNIEFWKKDLAGAEYALATTIGLKSEAGIIAGDADIDVSSSNLKRSVLQGTAITKRPDIESTLYETRMSKRDAVIALLELAPIPSFTLGNNYDSNQYLVFNNWMSLGGQAAANISKLLRYPSVNALNTEKIDLARQKAAAVLSAALLQVDMSLAYLLEVEKMLKTSQEVALVSEKLATHMHANQAAQQVGELQVVREDLRAFASRVRRDIALNDTRSAGARLMASVGVDFAVDADEDISSSAKRIRASVTEFRRGQGADIENVVGSDLIAKNLSQVDGVPNQPQLSSAPLKSPSKSRSVTDNAPSQLRGSGQ